MGKVEDITGRTGLGLQLQRRFQKSIGIGHNIKYQEKTREKQARIKRREKDELQTTRASIDACRRHRKREREKKKKIGRK